MPQRQPKASRGCIRGAGDKVSALRDERYSDSVARSITERYLTMPRVIRS